MFNFTYGSKSSLRVSRRESRIREVDYIQLQVAPDYFVVKDFSLKISTSPRHERRLQLQKVVRTRYNPSSREQCNLLPWLILWYILDFKGCQFRHIHLARLISRAMFHHTVSIILTNSVVTDHSIIKLDHDSTKIKKDEK